MKKFLAGILAGALLMTSTYAFAETKKSIEAVFGQVKLIVNGKSVDKETLLYNGTTYVPLRAAAEALGMEVGWDGKTNTASLTSKELVVQAGENDTQDIRECVREFYLNESLFKNYSTLSVDYVQIISPSEFEIIDIPSSGSLSKMSMSGVTGSGLTWLEYLTQNNAQLVKTTFSFDLTKEQLERGTLYIGGTYTQYSIVIKNTSGRYEIVDQNMVGFGWQ